MANDVQKISVIETDDDEKSRRPDIDEHAGFKVLSRNLEGDKWNVQLLSSPN